jgi:Arc/MetJ family transcription regulator
MRPHRRKDGHLPSSHSVASLTDAYRSTILMHMRTTLILDDSLIEEAREATGIREKTALVHAGLKALIAHEAARRLASLGGSEPRLRPVPRRRPRARQ